MPMISSTGRYGHWESKSAIIPAYRHDILLSANYAEYGKSTVFRTLICIKKFHYQNFPLKEKRLNHNFCGI